MYKLLQDTGINGWYKLIDKINKMGVEIVCMWEKNTTLYAIVKHQPIKPTKEEIFNLPDEAFLTDKPEKKKRG